MSSIPKKTKKRRKTNSKPNGISTTKLLLIFLGTIFILYGILIGDIQTNTLVISSYYLIALGLFFQGLCIALFVKENKIKST